MNVDQHIIRSLNMDFRFSNEDDAMLLHPRLSGLCRNKLNSRFENILNKYDIDDKHIVIRNITLDLSLVANNNFENEFLEKAEKQLDEKLSELFGEVLHAKSNNVSVISKTYNKLNLLKEFLIRGYISGKTISITWESLFIYCIDNETEGLINLLKAHITSDIFRLRLINQFSDSALFKLISAANPADATFIISYLQNAIEIPTENQTITKKERREISFGIALLYILANRGSRFNRKSFLIFNINKLSAHYKITTPGLLNELLVSVKSKSDIVHKSELISLISELKQEYQLITDEQNSEKTALGSDFVNIQLRKWLASGKLPEKQLEVLRTNIIKLLGTTEKRKVFLDGLTEIERFRLIELIAPKKSYTVFSIVQKLEEFGKKVGADSLNKEKWDVIFSCLAEKSANDFKQSEIIEIIISETAKKTKLKKSDKEKLKKSLAENKEVKADYYHEKLKIQTVVFLFRKWIDEDKPDIPIKENLKQRIISLLIQPISRKEFLHKLSEKEIHTVVELIEPAEAPFIIHYANTLEKEKERGVLEGKSAGEFRLLKWEFIFTALLEERGSTFNRKSFVKSVIYSISAHYNITRKTIFEFLYRGIIEKSGQYTSELSSLLKELYFEWKEEQVKEKTKSGVDKQIQELLYKKTLIDFIKTGIVTDEYFTTRMYDVFSYLKLYRTDLLNDVVERLKSGFILDDDTVVKSHSKLYRELIYYVITHYGLSIPGINKVKSLFQNISENKLVSVPIINYKTMLIACLKNDVEIFENTWLKLTENASNTDELYTDLIKYLPDNVILSLLINSSQTNQNKLVNKHMDLIFTRILSSPQLIRLISLQLRINPQLYVLLIETVDMKSLMLFVSKYISVIQAQSSFSEIKKMINEPLYRSITNIHETNRMLCDYIINLQQYSEKEAIKLFISQFIKIIPETDKGKTIIKHLTGDKAGLSTILKTIFTNELKFRKSSQKNLQPEISDLTQPDVLTKYLHDYLTGNNAKLSIFLINSNQIKQNIDHYLYQRIYFVLNKYPEHTKKLMLNDNVLMPKLIPWLTKSPEYVKLRWLKVMASTYVITYAEKLLSIQAVLTMEFNKLIPGKFPDELLVNLLLEFSSGKYKNLNQLQFLTLYFNKLKMISGINKHKIIMENLMNFAKEKDSVLANQISKIYNESNNPPDTSHEDNIPDSVDSRNLEEENDIIESVFISNAGLVLLTPYLPRLFEMLDLLENNKFNDKPAQQHAILAMQYLVKESETYPEHELVLNKIIAGYKTGSPVPSVADFSEKEKEIMKSLLEAVIQNWSGIKNTTVEGLRESFLQREGLLHEKSDSWELRVEAKAFDMLLDRLPWSYTPVKLMWMEKPIYVNWR